MVAAAGPADPAPHHPRGPPGQGGLLSDAEATRGSPWAPRLISLGLAAAFLGVYLKTLCPTVFWYDSAEYAAVAATLGIAHPPGYPLYTLLGHLFVTLLPGEPAWALNVMSALFGALAVGLCFAVARRLGARPLGAGVAAATLGAGNVFWHNAIVAEVYTPALATLLAVLWLLLPRPDDLSPGSSPTEGAEQGAPPRRWAPFAAAALAGAGLGLHYFIATAGVGLALLFLGSAVPPATPLRALPRALFEGPLGRLLRGFGGLLAAALAAAAVFAYLPLRSAMGPLIDPNEPQTLERLSWMLSGGNYGKDLGSSSAGAGLGRLASVLYDELLLVGLLLALLGLLTLLRRRPLHGLALVAIALCNSLFFLRYDVHDAEVFFLPTLMTLALAVAVGVDTLIEATRGAVGAARPLIPKVLAVALLAFPAAQLAVNANKVDLSGYTAARDYGETLCRDLPKGAIIVHFAQTAEWKSDAVFSMYFQKTLGRRKDVRVLQYPQPRHLLALWSRGAKVYLYAPMPKVAGLFELRKEGKLWRLGAPRRRPRWIAPPRR